MRLFPVIVHAKVMIFFNLGAPPITDAMGGFIRNEIATLPVTGCTTKPVENSHILAQLHLLGLGHRHAGICKAPAAKFTVGCFCKS